jgi:hypothetical protein
MSDRYIVISYKVDQGAQLIYVNKKSLIIDKDNLLHNGIVHVVDRVVEPSAIYLDAILKDHGEFNLFSEALALTNLQDSIILLYDENYYNPFPSGFKRIKNAEFDADFKTPEKKKYGYTLFAETDDVLKAAGIETVEQLVVFASQYYGTEDMNDYTSRKNPLNKFFAYHILNRQMATNAFIYTGNATSANAMDKKYEYYETLLPLRLMEINTGNKINTLKNGSFVAIDESKSNLDAVNGFAHALKNMLVYDEEVMQNDVLNKRIRFDCYAIPPQLTNNNIRWKVQWSSNPCTITPDYCEPYFMINDAVDIVMIANDYYNNYQSDEMLIYGWYDFTLRMHPVPPGTYEIRLGYRAETWRGIAQIFIDNEIIGIPVDLSKVGTDTNVGWVSDAATNDNGVENDKMMRNLGYMKAPNSIYSFNEGGINLRQDYKSLRIILGKFTFQDYAPHYFRMKNVEKEFAPFHFDYLEYVPAGYLDSEGID